MNKFLLTTIICIATVTTSVNAAPVNPTVINEALFQDAIDIPVSLSDMTHICRSIAQVTLHADPNVYSGHFTENTKIYLHGVHTLKDAMDNFTQAAGLRWKMKSENQIEIYRQPEAVSSGR